MRKMLRPLSRVFSTLMVVSLLTVSMGIPMVSAQTPEISIQDVELQLTPETVPITLSNFTDLGGLTITLDWDPTLVSVSLSQGTLGGATLGN
ncbi:MAG: hypothetical protein GX600_05660, partial [Dehalococcoidia bacterium]|nr:hypothetical protein [Dehalococcoidia bacterium]